MLRTFALALLLPLVACISSNSLPPTGVGTGPGGTISGEDIQAAAAKPGSTRALAAATQGRPSPRATTAA